MDWIPTLLKHLEASRVVVGVIFVAALVAYIGPRAAPAYIEAVPQGWGWLVVCTGVVSGGLLSGWATQWATARLQAWRRSRDQQRGRERLTADEKTLLLCLADGPTDWHSIDEFTRAGSPYSKLQVAEAFKQLSRVGLVILTREQASARLTDDGTALALQLDSGGELLWERIRVARLP